MNFSEMNIAIRGIFWYLSGVKRIENGFPRRILHDGGSAPAEPKKGRDHLMKKWTALLLALALTFVCAASLAEKAKAKEQIYYDVYSAEWVTLNYMYKSASGGTANFVDTLVEYDNYGILQPCLAESWECSEDGLTWTFHIRPGVQWMTADMEEYGAEVVADDFVYSASRVLDSTLEQVSKTSDILYVIKNAEAYFNGECEWEDVGVKAIDDYTLQYTLEQPVAYFESMLSYVCFMPCNREFGEEMGEDFGTGNYSLLYNGAFILNEWEPNANRVLIRNPEYWDIEDIHIEEIRMTFNSEASMLSAELFKRGEVMTASLTASEAQTWLADPELSQMLRPSRAAFNFSFWYAFNFYIKGADGSYTYPAEYNPENYFAAAQNKNFRKSIFHALDRVGAMMTKVSDEASARSLMINTITPPGFATGAGEYTQTGSLAAIANTDSYNADLALEYKAKAVEELTAAGVTFPVVLYMPYNTGESDLTQRAQVVEQQLEGLLGSDYIDIVLEGYANDNYLNTTRRAGNYSFMEVYWGPDYADPYTFTDPFRVSQKYAYIFMGNGLGTPATEDTPGAKQDRLGSYWTDLVYDQMVEPAYTEQDLAKRYAILAEAEAWLIDEAYVIPFCMDGGGYVASYLNPFESQYAPFGVSENRYKYQWIYETPMGMDEYETALAEWEAERDARLAALVK